jgi:hypothetical protein
MIRRDRDVIFEPMTDGKNMAPMSQVRRQAFKLEMVLGLARFAKESDGDLPKNCGLLSDPY